ncbi:hypothetical protein [Patiriisocius sp. Uisw_017]|jgi:hypothetical protein|uniref:hypothetical protein n=1 Tax=Patiriisocius sp. Uisw_017 TaxID=3230968 RepID=UPI0039E7B247
MRSIISLNSLHYLVAAETKAWFTIDKQTIKIAPFKLSEKGIEIEPKSSRNIIKDAAAAL